MTVDLEINNSADPLARYVSWGLSPCRVRLSDSTGATAPSQKVTISARTNQSGGAIEFRVKPKDKATATLSADLPTSGNPVPFFVSGVFGRSSNNDQDVQIEVRNGAGLLGQVPLMVRIRKNANLLSASERDRFVSAFARFNNRGTGRFTDLRNIHTDAGDPEAHRNAGFLPWHRMYLLDLERELQAIDPSIALPYWRFDQPAPNIFTPDFLGSSSEDGTVQFNPTNPLQFWVTDGVQGIDRTPQFDTKKEGATVISEAQTLALGGSKSLYSSFRGMEVNPHGWAHGSFAGSISVIGTAARDPLFFLLHANVDRLWAKWQRRFSRFDPSIAASFDGAQHNRIGHNLLDTMWPWNGITAAPRPPTAPGGPMPVSPCVGAPGGEPKVRDGLDYQGRLPGNSDLGFDYDDVPM